LAAAGADDRWPKSGVLFRLPPPFIADLTSCPAGTFPFSRRLFSATGGTAAINGKREWAMLGWVITFLVIALIAGLLGFGGIAGVSIEIAKVIFFIAVVLFLISAIVGLARRGRV
jgi:uncharacterized membrane protein YtjA (UPF0391 family)